jgi:hypothetical protein
MPAAYDNNKRRLEPPMSEKRMLIVDADVVKTIEENRGDMNISDFINYLINSQLKSEVNTQNGSHVTKEEFQQFEQGIRELLRNFLEFFLSYGMELGKQTTDKELDKLGEKLQSLGFSKTVTKS